MYEKCCNCDVSEESTAYPSPLIQNPLPTCWYQTYGEQDEGVWRQTEMKGRSDGVCTHEEKVEKQGEGWITRPHASRSPLLHFSLFYACCVFLKALSFFVTFFPASHFSPLFVASAGRMTGDSIAACSAGLYHNVHAKYSSLGSCACMCVRAQRTEGNRGRLWKLVRACMFASRRSWTKAIHWSHGSYWVLCWKALWVWSFLRRTL